MNNQKQNRGRHRNNARRSNPARQHYDSNGPGVRIRGSATQVYEKYIQLARDAQSGGDRVLAENMLQYAEHYFRILNEHAPERGQTRQQEVDPATAAQPDLSVVNKETDPETPGAGDEAAQDHGVAQTMTRGRPRRPTGENSRGNSRNRRSEQAGTSPEESPAAEATAESDHGSDHGEAETISTLVPDLPTETVEATNVTAD